MNAPFPRGVPTTGVVAQEIQIPTRTLVPHRPRLHRRRRGGRRDSDRNVHNHATERWMVSYADFITLLFAFFVVMYAMSSVNVGRYQVVSGSLSAAFVSRDGSAASRNAAKADIDGVAVDGDHSGGVSRSRSKRPSSALKTSLQRPQRTQPSDTLS